MTGQRLRIGTRRSRLAMRQAELVAAELRSRHKDIAVDIIPIQTLGDRDKSTSLAGLGRVGVFTKEIEEALLDGRCDLAVHSYKDLATRLPPGLSVGAVVAREDPRDVLISRTDCPLDDLPPGSMVGTSSLRRRALILHRRPDLKVNDLRGNVPTRLRAAGVCLDGSSAKPNLSVDATVMALSGLTRLGLERHATEVFSADEFLPAPAQGALALEIRVHDLDTARLLEVIDHEPSRWATAAEREFLTTMEGGCHVPLGALARVEDRSVTLAGIVVSPDGRKAVGGEASGRDPAEVGRTLAEDLLRRGADEILAGLKAAGDAWRKL